MKILTNEIESKIEELKKYSKQFMGMNNWELFIEVEVIDDGGLIKEPDAKNFGWFANSVKQIMYVRKTTLLTPFSQKPNIKLINLDDILMIEKVK